MSDRLNVLLIPDWYPSPEHPVQGPFMRDLARAISRFHEVTVLAPPSHRAPRDVVDEGIRVIRLPKTRATGRLATLMRLLSIDRTVARLAGEGTPPDLIHAHVFSAGFLAVLVGRRRRLPVVITENYSGIVTNSVTGWDARIARFAYRRAACVCPVSPLVEQHLRRLEPRGRYEVVPDVVDVDAFSSSPREPRTSPGSAIIAVSHLVARKGLGDLVGAVRRLVADGRPITVSVIGEGPQRPALEALAEGLPITFLGSRPREDVVALVQEADAFAMPTLADPFGISAVEALAAGVPIVVTSSSGTADLIAAYGGLVVPPGDSKALSEALAELLDDPHAVPTTAAAELRNYCGPDAVGRRLDGIYHSLRRVTH